MRGSHAAPAFGGLASSAGTISRPQWSCPTSLPLTVAEGPVVGRPVARAIWVRRVVHFLPGDSPPLCSGCVAKPTQLPAVHWGLGPCARLWCLCSPARSQPFWSWESVWGRYDRIFRFRSNTSPASRESHYPSPQPTGPVVHRSPPATHSTRPQAVWAPGLCGSRGLSLVCGPHFPCMRKPRGWSRPASLAPRVAAHHARAR